MSVQDSSFVSAVMIYFLDNKAIDQSAIEAHAKTLLPNFQKVNSFSDDPASDRFQLTTLKKGEDEFMNLDTMVYPDSFLQLGDEETAALKKSDRAVQLVFYGTERDISKKQQNVTQLVYEITRDKKVVIVDLNTFEFFNVPLWKENRLRPFMEEPLNVTSQVTIHTYREDGFCRAVTLGMNKFCLPEISIKNFPCSDQNSYGNLINAAIQTLFENPTINGDSTLKIDLQNIKNKPLRQLLLSSCKKNAALVVDIKLKHVEIEEGDNYAPQLRIAFEDSNYSSPQEEASQVISTLFGADDSPVYSNHDDELLKASKKAQQRIPELKQLFNSGLEPGYSLMVKIPFETDSGGNEWMWVEITKWEESGLKGILQNDPFDIENLKAGAIVEFSESDIFDYLLNKPDGTFEGNETGKILEDRNE